MKTRAATVLVAAAGLVAIGGLLWTSRRDAQTGPPSDTPAFHARATIDTAGRVAIRSHVGVFDVGSLGGDDPAAKAATIDRLYAEFKKLTAAPAPRDADGASLVTLELDAQAATPWRMISWIAQVANSPASIYIRRVRFLIAERPGEAIDHELLKDEGIEVPADTSKMIDALKLQFTWTRDTELSDGGRSLLRVAVVKEPLYHDEEDGEDREDETPWEEIPADYRSIRNWIGRATARNRDIAALVEVSPSAWLRAGITYGEVFTVLRALRDENVAPVKLWGDFPSLPAAPRDYGR